jgi:hypothetical protein
VEIKVADECWVALALLTQENPERNSFTSREMLERIRREHVHPEFRQSLHAHIHQHNIANCRPSTARYRMFYRVDDGTLRLYQPGDVPDPDRSGKTHPVRDELPLKYQPLLDWYEQGYCKGEKPAENEPDPILSLRGLGKELWEGVDPDAWVSELRSGWDMEPAAAGTAIATSPEVRGPLLADTDRIWRRIVRHQGAEFRTQTDLPFTYEIEGESGIRFFREGHRIEHRLRRGQVEEALRTLPLTKPSDLKKFQCPSYLFGLLTDPRIAGRDERR